MLVRSLPVKRRKRFPLNAGYTSATQTGLVRDVTGAGRKMAAFTAVFFWVFFLRLSFFFFFWCVCVVVVQDHKSTRELLRVRFLLLPSYAQGPLRYFTLGPPFSKETSRDTKVAAKAVAETD